jgi:hypothetical protein
MGIVEGRWTYRTKNSEAQSARTWSSARRSSAGDLKKEIDGFKGLENGR